MGTASTMNALAEALGMALPGSAAIPAPYRERGQCAYETGLRIVEMVHSDRKPSDIMTREAFENVIVVNTAIGGSTNAPIHINAIAKHIGVEVSLDDWDRLGFHIPLLLNMQPAGELLGEEYYRAGGLPAIMAELLDARKLNPDALTCNGYTVAENVRDKHTWDRRMIKPYNEPLLEDAGFLHLQGSLFRSAIMKTCVISEPFRQKFLENPKDPNAFEGTVVVFDGPEDYHHRLEDPSTPIDDRSILVMRGAGPLGYPGAAEVVNMHPPGRLLRQGVKSLPCIGDGRQSGTSGSPSILNASPEAAAGGNLALLQDGDRLRVDLNKRRVDILVSTEELEKRRKTLEAQGGYDVPESQTPWQELFRRETTQLSDGMVLRDAIIRTWLGVLTWSTSSTNPPDVCNKAAQGDKTKRISQQKLPIRRPRKKERKKARKQEKFDGLPMSKAKNGFLKMAVVSNHIHPETNPGGRDITSFSTVWRADHVIVINIVDCQAIES
ncbi:unnamed protein product [Aspergillus oryzae]|nr:unnamed protein product [Aspergillus oryzae]